MSSNDMYQQGLNYQKIFKEPSDINALRQAIDSLLKNQKTSNIVDFISGLLNDSTNKYFFETAFYIADKFDVDGVIWDSFIDEIYDLHLNNNTFEGFQDLIFFKIPESKTFANNISDYSMNIMIDIFTDIDINTDRWWSYLTYTTLFDKNKNLVKNAILNNFNKFKYNKLTSGILDTFLEMNFYYDIMDKKPSSDIITLIFQTILQHNASIDGFDGGKTVDLLINRYTNINDKNVNAINWLTSLILLVHTDETDKLIIKLFKNYPGASQESKALWLIKIRSTLTSDIIDEQLFLLTHDSRYLSDDIKDIFLI